MRGPLRTHRRREMKRRPTFRWFLRVTALVLVATLVSSTVATLQSISTFSGVRWAGPLEPADKVPSSVLSDRVGPWARAGGRFILAVTFHSDVSMAEAHSLVQSLGGQVLSTADVAS